MKLRNQTLWIFILIFFVSGCKKNFNTPELNSPDRLYTYKLDLNDGLAYSVNWNTKIIIQKSALCFKLSDGSILPDGVRIKNVEKVSRNKDWKPVYDERKVYTDNYKEALIQINCKNFQREMALRVRAYNKGVAFR